MRWNSKASLNEQVLQVFILSDRFGAQIGWNIDLRSILLRAGHRALHPAILRAAKTLTERYGLGATSQPSPRGLSPEQEFSEAGDFDHLDFSQCIHPESDVDQPVESGSDTAHPDTAPSGPEYQYFKGAALTHGRGETFIETMCRDKFRKERETNLYYPFCSGGDWEYGSFLSLSSMSQSSIDGLLGLELTAKMNLSFRTTKELRNRIKMLPKGPEWKAIPWATTYPTKKPLTLYYCDPLECLQFLLSNPLIQDHVHFTPFRLWSNSEKLMRIYTEWLSGDVAWEIQEQLPPGATLLGTIISTDKRQLTTMTGNRSAYPMLISLADLDMDFRMKAAHYASLLLALIPIAKFREKDAKVRGVLANRLFHAVLDFVLAPLKKCAEIGMMMSDPLGWRRWCFMPLVGYIVDTSESALIAGVAGKQSSVTIASYKEFGDPFRHPPRTANHTIKQLMKLEETMDPWDLPTYIKSAKALGLNEPSNFLTPEILHHWLKMFHDHVVKWCIEAVGTAEIDFRFGVLRPHSGMCHFREGISKAKQTTGRDHRDIMCYLVAVIAGAKGVTKGFLAAIASLVNFFYHGQAPVITDDVLSKMDHSLEKFHAHKQAILDAGAQRGKKGVIENCADVTEHAHITLVKDPAANSNRQEYEAQICRHLDRRDKCRQFELATAMEAAGVEFLAPELRPDEDGLTSFIDETYDLLDEIDPVTELGGTGRVAVNYFTHSALLAEGKFPNAPLPYRTFTASDNTTAFHLNCHPAGRQMDVETAGTRFRVPDLRAALATYLHRQTGLTLAIGGKRPSLRNHFLPFEKIEIWKNIHIQSRSFHDANKILVPETVNAAPPSDMVDGAPSDGSNWKVGRADAVIVNTDAQYEWPRSGLNGHAVCQLRMIFRVVPRRGRLPPLGTSRFLAYVQRFDITGTDPASGMYMLRWGRRADNSIMGDIIPLDRLRAPVELTPRFGKVADPRLSKETSLDFCDEFWLSKWYNKELFFGLSHS
ncbi:hypothetical protein C8F04DRAFT_1187525 [Mycena alexandri]|uniref:DUF6830 domain-containing protein n=1 Tax=Mycena alexandri TaxID=1745969 RepID=A0AAD6SNK3_9AGAR|nr:hypothetical protein C8F04DRAFT_1187525 [Mycena alexandri]